MKDDSAQQIPIKAEQLDSIEKKVLNQKIEHLLVNWMFKNVGFGGVLNILVGIWLTCENYNHTSNDFNLIVWCTIIIFINLCNIIASLYYFYIRPPIEKSRSWRIVSRIAIVAVSIAYSSMNFLIMPTEISQQYFMLFVFYAVISCFALGEISDLIAAILTLAVFLIPPILWPFIKNYYPFYLMGNPALNLNTCIILAIYGTFMLFVSFVGYYFVKRYIEREFILEDINTKLDKRVAERTQDLNIALEKVTHQASHDLLTDLPNQLQLDQYLDTAISEKQPFGVIVFSLNRLRKIDDGFGYHVGDTVIKVVADRLVKKLSEISKLDKTEYILTLPRREAFVILIKPLKRENAELTASSLFSILEKSVFINDKQARQTASIGVSLFENNGESANELLINADAALTSAKKYGLNKVELYQSTLVKYTPENIDLENKLYLAIDNGEVEIHYQPLIEINTGKVIGMEALARWRLKPEGMISPVIFIPVAEETGFILPLGEWILRKSVQQLKDWHEQGFDNLKISVNLSAKQLIYKDMGETVISVLNDTKLASKFLDLELTESMSMVTDERIKIILKQFKSLGLSLSIDDFGTGFSGFSYLKLFKIDKIKIDISFIRDILKNSEDQVIVNGIIAMAKAMGIKTVAEGVETVEQFDYLKSIGCDYSQGYIAGFKPMAADDFTRFLESCYKEGAYNKIYSLDSSQKKLV